MIVIKNLLVATDHSDVSMTALNYGRALARAYGSTLHVVNVVENFFTVTGLEGYIGDAGGVSQDIEQAARRQLDGAITDDDRRRLRAKGILLSSDRPAVAIARYARDATIDLIVMGTNGHGRLSRLLMGSVTERIVGLAPCPVLIVRQPEHEFVVPDPPAGVRRHA
ncbi:MAG: universal stress protein [Acidobacteriia bacterium]|nr:universal stress protein [Terriglobia bacterium]